MKKIVTLLLLITALLSRAQEISLELQERVIKSPYIFEGEVLESHSYRTQDNLYIYTSNLVRIHKIFKGSLECGTVEIITFGGSIDNKSMDCDHCLTLRKGSIGIFLTNLSTKESSLIDFYQETNLLKLGPKFETQSFLHYWVDSFSIRVSDVEHAFSSVPEIYEYMQTYGIQYTNCDETSTDFYKKLLPKKSPTTQKKIAPQKEEQEIKIDTNFNTSDVKITPKKDVKKKAMQTQI